MKKYLSILLSMILILSLTACGKTTDSNVAEVPAEEELNTETDAPESETLETDAPGVLVVKPLPVTIDLNNLQDCTLAVSMESGSITASDDTFKIKVKVYDYELFDMVDVSMLEVGSILEINQEKVEITSIETNDFGTVILNGGLDAGSYELFTNENGVYYSIGYSDLKTYFELGEVELTLSPEFVYTDSSDLDAGAKEYTAEELIDLEYTGTPHNTSLIVENGVVTSMKKVYTP